MDIRACERRAGAQEAAVKKVMFGSEARLGSPED